MSFRTLRVINHDRAKPGAGLGTHGHSDMEILWYVLEGALEHKDLSGIGGVIRPGEIQLMVWIVPDTRGLKPEERALKVILRSS